MSWIIILLRQIVICYLFTVVSGTIQTAGYHFQSDSALERDAQGVFLIDDVIFPRSVIFNVSVYCVRPDRSVWVQIWRPVRNTSMTYRLVGQTKITSGPVPKYYQKILRRSELIVTEAGDKLAIYHENAVSPVAYTFAQSTITPVYRSLPANNFTMSIGSEVSFLDFKFPYQFSVSVTYDTDVNAYTRNGTRTIIDTTVSTTTVQTVPPMPTSQGSLVYVGNPLTPRNNVITSNARAVYILPHLRFSRGVVVRFFAYFARKAPLWFQIWRPLKSDNANAYILVGQIRVEPILFPWRQEFALNSTDYIFTEDNDILGILVEGEVNPVGFTWIYDQTDIKPLASRPETDNPGHLVAGTILTFSNVQLPYDFSIGALYDTNPSPEKYMTPEPISTTTTTSTTTSTAVTTTVNIVHDPSIGKDTIRATQRSLKNHGRKTFLLWDTQFPEEAIVTSFYAYFVNPGQMAFQVWRRIEADKFLLVGQKKYTADRRGYIEVSLLPEERFQVMANDCLGYYNMEPKLGTVGYHFQASSLYYNEEDGDIKVGQIGVFQDMVFPYRFAVAASFKPGGAPKPAYKDSCPPNCDNTAQFQQTKLSKTSWVLNPGFLIGLFIWLICLTLVMFITCFIMARHLKRSDISHRYCRRPHSFTNLVTSSFSGYDRQAKMDDVRNDINITGGRDFIVKQQSDNGRVLTHM